MRREDGNGNPNDNQIRMFFWNNTAGGGAGAWQSLDRSPPMVSGQLIPVPMAEWIQRDLAKIGIKMKLKTYEWITYIGYWIKGMDDASNKVGSQQMSWGMTSDYWIDIVTNSSHIAPAGGAGQEPQRRTAAAKHVARKDRQHHGVRIPHETEQRGEDQNAAHGTKGANVLPAFPGLLDQAGGAVAHLLRRDAHHEQRRDHGQIADAVDERLPVGILGDELVDLCLRTQRGEAGAALQFVFRLDIG